MGRHKLAETTAHISANVSQEMKDELLALAGELDRDLSSMIRILLREALDSRKNFKES